MANDYYDIIYHNIVSEEDRASLAENLVTKFKLSHEKALLLLATNQPVCLKKKVDLQTALKYEVALKSINLQCKISNHQEGQNQSFIEKRSGERRQTPDRRNHYRSSAVQPDRRQRDRRSTA